MLCVQYHGKMSAHYILNTIFLAGQRTEIVLILATVLHTAQTPECKSIIRKTAAAAWEAHEYDDHHDKL